MSCLMSIVILFSFSFSLISFNMQESNAGITPKNMISELQGEKQRHIVLLGASIGRIWNISMLSNRINCFNYAFEYVGGGGFDKSRRLNGIISRQENKPDAILLKECAAYFPGDLNRYKKLMMKWIHQCQVAGIVPIPTTVVPVTRLHSLKKFFIDVVKGRNPLNYGNPFLNRRNLSIIEYNDWIRMYCQRNGLNFLDLEKALRYSEKNRYLREDFAKLDGLHLNRKAYRILDKIVIPTLEGVYWRGNKNSE